MGVGRYFILLVIMFVTFLSLVNVIFKLPVVRYEFILTAVLLLFAIIIMLGVLNDSHWAYMLGALFFAVNLINLVYLYYKVESASLVWLAVASALGFVICVASLGTKKEEHEEIIEKSREIEKQLGPKEEIPKVTIIEEEKKPRKRAKPARKRASKKR